MQEQIRDKGIIIKAEPIGEYDRRVVILTENRGKISAFARGARRPNSKFVASTNPFVFGNISLFAGRNSYTLTDMEAVEYFDSLRLDFDKSMYGMYFLELADYYTRENNDDRDMLKLLFVSLKALSRGLIDNRLIRAIFELRAVAVNGEFPGLELRSMSETAEYTIKFIISADFAKLYSFTLKDEVMNEVINYSALVVDKMIHHSFNSLLLLE
ncbi:MAG: DNA repair protein RecO [Lachnospiraceae bacterium]|nr:DNA repair protein RecO [Lachnospiraceae bacterium]MDD7547967.1 DNA repair protein RecO [Lachnospiraceae bacterium]MDY4999842.1 DNA repair protein RecO [Lachnospiraceae bacterium]